MAPLRPGADTESWVRIGETQIAQDILEQFSLTAITVPLRV
jgi:hypothetical protein